LKSRAIRDLSGGWRVRLLLATAVARGADVLLLDEPTNHLDVEAVEWLVGYITRDQTATTCVIVSHDAPFLNKVCSDIIHFDDYQLKYYSGNFANFQEQAVVHDADEVQALLQVRSDEAKSMVDIKTLKPADTGIRFHFPTPGRVEGVTSITKAVITVCNASFQYPLTEDYVLRNVNCQVSMSSRVAIVGPNGAGKSTLMSLLCGEIRPSVDKKDNTGSVDRHRCLRLAYVAQDPGSHLPEYSGCTAVQYIQYRFRNGYDEELQKRLNSATDKKEELTLNTLAAQHGKYGKRVEAIPSRVKRQKEWRYEVKWDGLNEKQNTIEPLSRLRQLGVDRMATALDERLASVQSGANLRPLTQHEITKHFEGFGLSRDMVSTQQLSTYSGGQRSKLLIGAAFWTRPHVICLDEPTNFLDFETVSVLSRELRHFRGGVVVVSHNDDFLSSCCNEIWDVRHNEVSVATVADTEHSYEDWDQ